MLTKKFTDFSADLLDTVRGVLGEAKKCKDCGCAKCECEDEDMEEGYVPTSDEPTEANKKTADKVRALLAKEKKPVKEEIDDALEAELKAQRQTKKSVADAKKKYGVKEEVEQIDELSGKTLASYSSKVANYGPMKDTKTREKHEKGLYTAYKKMKAKDVKVPARMEEAEQIDEENHYTVHKAEKGWHVNQHGVNGVWHHSVQTGYHDTKEKAVAWAKKHAGSRPHKIEIKEEQIDEISKKLAVKTYAKRAGRAFNDGVYDDESEKDYDKRDKTGERIQKKFGKKTLHKAIGAAHKGIFGEEAEQIDELSKGTLGRYINKAATRMGSQGVTAGLKIAADEKSSKNFKDMAKREKGIARAVGKLTKEEQDFIDALNADTLDEARGRPKKAGGKDFTIHPKTKEKLMHNNPEHMKKIELLQKHGVLEKPKTEAGQHIINQLQKAKTSMTGGTKIHFTHGDSKEVSGAHASKLLDKYAGMKPNEKEDFQKKIGHSHEQLMKHV